MTIFIKNNEVSSEKRNAPTLRLLIVSDTSNYIGAVPVSGMKARHFELAKHLVTEATDVHSVYANFILEDLGSFDHSWKGWPFETVVASSRDLRELSPSLVSEISRNKPDCIVISNSLDVLTFGRKLSSILGCKLIYEAHDNESEFLENTGAIELEVEEASALQIQAVRVADATIALTEEDAEAMGGEAHDVHVIPMGTTLTPREYRTMEVSRPFNVVFIGNLYHEPNAQSVRYILTKIAPSVSRTSPTCIFNIVGRAPQSLVDEIRKVSNASYIGPVEDLATTLQGMHIAISPVFIGSGMKTKLADYVGSGLPVIATQLSFRGYPQQVRDAIIEANSSEEFSKEIIGLMDSTTYKEAQQAIRESSSAITWANVAKRARDVYRKILLTSQVSIPLDLELEALAESKSTVWQESLEKENAWPYQTTTKLNSIFLINRNTN